MEHYYFIQKNGVKQGPYKLSELKLQTIYFDELIWRSDNSQWKKVSEFEELQGVFIIKPPPTPKEQKIYEVNDKFKNKILKNIAIIYVLTCIVISVFSFAIAQSSWDTYLKDIGGKYLGNNNNNYYSSGMVSYAELDDNKRYPYYTPGINNESSYGYGQEFFFRPFKAFFSTVYLTDEEQENSGVLFKNLTLSSFFSLSFIFLIAGFLYYIIKRSDITDENHLVNEGLIKTPESIEDFRDKENNSDEDFIFNIKKRVNECTEQNFKDLTFLRGILMTLSLRDDCRHVLARYKVKYDEDLCDEIRLKCTETKISNYILEPLINKGITQKKL